MHCFLFSHPGGGNLTFCLLFQHGESSSSKALTSRALSSTPPPLWTHALKLLLCCPPKNIKKNQMILKNNEEKSQFTQRYEKCPNALPFLNADHAIFFVLLLSTYLIQPRKCWHRVISLLICFMKTDHYSSKCHDEAVDDVSFEHKESNMCKGNGMHWFHTLPLVL